MIKMVRQIADGVFVQLPKEANKQFKEWAEIAEIDKLFAKPKRPEFFETYYPTFAINIINNNVHINS